MSDSHDVQGGFDALRRDLTEQLNRIDERLRPYDELLEAREKAAKALAALDAGKPLKKRVSWEEIALYVLEHPGSKAAEIAADLEVPVGNVYAHLERNQDHIFDKRKDGVYIKDGWETYRRKAGDR